MKKLLLVIDMVNGFVKEGALADNYINTITPNIINLIKRSDKIVHHLHIPLQSGSNRILILMNRKYTKEYYIDVIERIRSLIPNISITTDYIAGFPTETNEDHLESIDTINKCKFETIHTFPYSLRQNTVAAKLPQVEKEIKKERVRDILSISKENYKNYVLKNINNTLDVIFETYDNGYLFGHTGNYIYVKAKGNISLLNKYLKVKIISYEKIASIAEIIE